MPFYPSNVDLQGFVFRKAGGIVGGVIGGGGTPPVGGNTVWEALVPDASGVMQGVEVGTGGLTVPRVSRINLSDSASLYQAFAGGEPGWEGGRVEGAEGSRVVYATESGMPWLVHAPSATNASLYSNDQTNAIWELSAGNITATRDQVGLDGAPSTATILDKPVAGPYTLGTRQTINVPVAYALTTVNIRLKKDHVQGTHVSLVMWGGPRSCEVRISLDTGVITRGIGSYLDATIASDGDWWDAVITVPFAQDSQDIDLAIRPALTADGHEEVAGSCIIGNVELRFDTAHGKAIYALPIFTEGAAVTRDADGYVWDSANWNNTEGSFYGEVFVTGICNILGGFLAYDGAAIDLTDGTALQSLAAPMGQLVKVGAIWGGGSMKLNVNDSWHGTGSSYNGALLTGPLDFGRNSAVVLKGRNFKRWDVVDESLINEEMQA